MERRLANKGTGPNGSSDPERMQEQRSSGSKKFASWLSSKLSTNTSTTLWDQATTTTGPEVQTTILQTNVDVELGTITETVGEEEMDITRGQGLSGRTRVMSIDGRREGWLAPSTEGQERGRRLLQQQQQQQQQPKAKSAGRNILVPSSEVVFVGETVPEWDFIWDGRRTPFTETRLQELRHERPP